jgi:hypothetical protein
MDGKAEADAEEARYVQSKPPLGPEGGSQGIRTDIRPGHGFVASLCLRLHVRVRLLIDDWFEFIYHAGSA